VSVVHGLLSLQVSAVPARHVPDWQVSAPLHALPSLHAVPFATGVYWHTPALQRSAVHGFPSLQWVSVLQALHPAITVCVHPVTELQASSVHGVPSSQLGGTPG
jgi:hypothetical protein